jgi:hypothetical protein
MSDIAANLRAWGENDPDPEFFDGDVLMSVLAACREGADEIDALQSALRDAWKIIPNDLVGPWGMVHADVLRRLAIDDLSKEPSRG